MRIFIALIILLTSILLSPGEIAARRIVALGREGVIFQRTPYDCGIAALSMVFRHFEIPVDYEFLERELKTGPSGVTMWNLKNVAEERGLHCRGWRLTFSDLERVPLPAIVFLHRRHFAVVSEVTPSSDVFLLDPIRGKLRIPKRRFQEIWEGETLLFTQHDGAPNSWFREPNPIRRRNGL